MNLKQNLKMLSCIKVLGFVELKTENVFTFKYY